MALRTLVTGSDMCTGSDGAGPSNAVGALVNQLLGGAAKTQEQLRDVSGVGEAARLLLGDVAYVACACLACGRLCMHEATVVACLLCHSTAIA